MKTLFNKINPLAVLTLILGLGLMNGSFAQRSANAGMSNYVSAIQINGLQKYTGQYLRIIYAVGSPGPIDIENAAPYLEIQRPESKTVQITADSVIFPAAEVKRSHENPFRPSYNRIVFVISQTPQINWQNSNVNPNPPYLYMGQILKDQMDAFTLQNQNNPNAIYTINF